MAEELGSREEDAAPNILSAKTGTILQTRENELGHHAKTRAGFFRDQVVRSWC